MEALNDGNQEEVKDLTKQIKTIKTAERKEYIHQIIDKDSDVRETWAGIRELKKPYKPIPYAQKTKDGRTIKITDRAEAAADYFEFNIWNNKKPKHCTKGEN